MSFSFNNPLPRTDLPIAQEVSRLDSPRESSSLFHSWKRERDLGNRGESLTSSLSQIQRQISKIKINQKAFSNLRPFRLYQYPTWMRKFHPSDEWRRLKVRFGGVFNNTYENTSNVWSGGSGNIPFGCDNFGVYTIYAGGLFSDAYSEQFLNPNETEPNDATAIASGWHEAIIPNDGNTYAIWISMCGAAMGLASFGTPVICYGTSPTGCKEMYTGTTVNDPWPTWTNTNTLPVIGNDPYHWLIGTAVAFNGILSVTQVLDSNVMFNFAQRLTTNANYGVPFNARFRGEYQTQLHYYVGDEVTVTGTDFTQRYLYFPKSPNDSGTFWYGLGPISGTSPATNSPEPWLLVGNFPNVTTEIWATGAYDATKSYLRKV